MALSEEAAYGAEELLPNSTGMSNPVSTRHYVPGLELIHRGKSGRTSF
jgi:hypothetical protein